MVDEACYSAVNARGYGALQISAARRDDGKFVTRAELLRSIERHKPADADAQDVLVGRRVGLRYACVRGTTHWRHWEIACLDEIVHITYNCPVEIAGREDAEVDALLATLVVKE